MSGKSIRLRRWASLSALTSAALAASAASGEAAIIYHPTPGLTLSGNGSAFLALGGGNGISLRGSGGQLTVQTNYTRHTFYGPHGRAQGILSFKSNLKSGTANISAKGVSFRKAGGLIAVGNKGRTFNQIGTGAVGAAVVAHHESQISKKSGHFTYFYGPRPGNIFTAFAGAPPQTTTGPGFRLTTRSSVSYPNGQTKVDRYRLIQLKGYSPPGYSKEYALFRFDNAGQTDYGWLELSLINGFDTGPILDILGYAYDTTGAPIRAGAIPEPAHLPLALGAFALGAIGLREWRAKRKAIA